MLWGKTESKNVRLRNVWRTHTKVRSTLSTLFVEPWLLVKKFLH